MKDIQKLLKAPKGQTNTFGGYQYRSCEDIVEAVKPILHERGYFLNITDRMIILGDRMYVEATARVMERVEGQDGSRVIAEAVGNAREALSKKGMDDSQITGAASSYARKYALNGLFAIDDTKDADTDEHAQQKEGAPQGKDQAQKAPTDGEKPWYNDFDSHKDAMLAKIESNESTADQIITNLRNTYKISRKTADQIKNLEASLQQAQKQTADDAFFDDDIPF